MLDRHGLRKFLILSFLVLSAFAGGPAMLHAQQARQSSEHPGANMLRLETRDRSVVTFSNDAWKLTMTGVHGNAHVLQSDGVTATKDTTLSYFDIASAAGSGRGKTTSQFLLTVLGVILVIGLAAIVLYAAFLATDR